MHEAKYIRRPAQIPSLHPGREMKRLVFGRHQADDRYRRRPEYEMAQGRRVGLTSPRLGLGQGKSPSIMSQNDGWSGQRSGGSQIASQTSKSSASIVKTGRSSCGAFPSRYGGPKRARNRGAGRHGTEGTGKRNNLIRGPSRINHGRSRRRCLAAAGARKDPPTEIKRGKNERTQGRRDQ